MTEKKRYFYDNKRVAILKDNEFWLECAISTACNHSEICNELNQLNDENEKLKSELKALRKKYNDFSDMVEQRLKEMDMGLVR